MKFLKTPCMLSIIQFVYLAKFLSSRFHPYQVTIFFFIIHKLWSKVLRNISILYHQISPTSFISHWWHANSIMPLYHLAFYYEKELFLLMYLFTLMWKYRFMDFYFIQWITIPYCLYSFWQGSFPGFTSENPFELAIVYLDVIIWHILSARVVIFSKVPDFLLAQDDISNQVRGTR